MDTDLFFWSMNTNNSEISNKSIPGGFWRRMEGRDHFQNKGNVHKKIMTVWKSIQKQ